MYPTISHLIYDITGLKIPLPIQTFGFWVAIAFLVASYILTIELKRKEKEGLLHSIKINITTGEKLKISQIIISFVSSFLIGFKLIEAFFHYNDLVANPQAFVLSSRGNLWGGILIGIIAIYIKWKENNKHRLPIPKTISKKV